eukprot:CAMPEP_0114430224 /NCGR_PEP_ID=MMETSP0103-20121206/9920_1 /TAXON_ID=37642 ORGANISM="Paraphysomonas imperforata, Strain PA2" /NCGR_SAMPLE_ID=MMETSP0103 /ASSEMBLY_ACC=CAM_ASM_000201 /LENGTH=358 /DNA_ID=CAMNT_0001599643 /DNA_START=236 /DNA_END=1312 /DNA_ORIENTATION=-
MSMRNIRVNGDGFGIAWYPSETPREDGSCTFKIPTPVWSDKNLQRLGHFISAPVIMGHIRAASDGYNALEAVIISHENCHPFKCGRYTFMHNGGIPSFAKMKRDVCNLLRLENYLEIDGSTDSEHIFALFLSNLCSKDMQLPASAIAEALNQTIGILLELSLEHNIGPSSLNITVTDGVHVVVSRFRNSAHSQPPSLYYSIGSNYSTEEGNFTVREDSSEYTGVDSGLLISSCPLNKECVEVADDDGNCCTSWKLIPQNTLLVCSGDTQDLTKIKDHVFIPLQYPNSLNDTDTPSLHQDSGSDNSGSPLDGLCMDTCTTTRENTPPGLDGPIFHCPIKRHGSEGYLDLAYNTDCGSNS